MEIGQFIDQFNSINPEYDHIKAKYGNQGDILFPNGMWYPITLLHSNKVSNHIEDLLRNTNISTVGVGSITFWHEFKILSNKYLEFAQYNDSESVCLDSVGGCIYSYWEEFDDFELLSPTIDLFLEFLLLYRWRDINIIFGERLPDNFNSRVITLKKMGFSKQWLEEFLEPS